MEHIYFEYFYRRQSRRTFRQEMKHGRTSLLVRRRRACVVSYNRVTVFLKGRLYRPLRKTVTAGVLEHNG